MFYRFHKNALVYYLQPPISVRVCVYIMHELKRYSHSTVTTDKELGLVCVGGGSSFFFGAGGSLLRGALGG